MNGKTLTTPELKTLIQPRLAPYRKNVPDRFSGFSDEKYYLPSEQEFLTLNSELKIKEIIYAKVDQASVAPGKIDCDDFALLYKSQATLLARSAIPNAKFTTCIGICWGKFDWKKNKKGAHVYHAANFVVLSKGELRWIESTEPDSNGLATIYPLNKAVGEIRFVLI